MNTWLEPTLILPLLPFLCFNTLYFVKKTGHGYRALSAISLVLCLGLSAYLYLTLAKY